MRKEYGNLPSIEEMEAMAQKAFEDLPAEIRAQCNDVIVRVEDFPSREVLERMEIDDPFGLLGLYHGESMLDRSMMAPTHFPDMVYLYRRPILEYWRVSGTSLEELVTHVLVHEIGHHMGFSDDDMHRIEETD